MYTAFPKWVFAAFDGSPSSGHSHSTIPRLSSMPCQALLFQSHTPHLTAWDPHSPPGLKACFKPRPLKICAFPFRSTSPEHSACLFFITDLMHRLPEIFPINIPSLVSSPDVSLFETALGYLIQRILPSSHSHPL